MPCLPPDPLEGLGLADYGRLLRQGEITAEAATATYLRRIALLDGKLGAFDHVAGEDARETARALDQLLASGTDLGPLMGVPVAIKDLLATDSMPLRAGSRLDLADLAPAEGTIIKRLRAAGCVFLGKAKTVELAFGATGISAPRGTPWNPADAKVKRVPGGSSSGSAVAVAAGLAALAVGTDTGGSVRIPAALCGITGLKTSDGRWPGDGVIGLSKTFDTVGLLCRSAGDAALAFSAIDQSATLPERDPTTIRLGLPVNHYLDGLDEEVAGRFDGAIRRLRDAGVQISRIEVPEVAEGDEIFTSILGPELLAWLGRERFAAGRDLMDREVRARIEVSHYVPADSYIRAIERRRELVEIASARVTGLDGWITPATSITAPKVADFNAPENAMRLALGITRNAQPGNLFAQCGLSIPIPGKPGSPPVGLQIMGRQGHDAELLAIGRAIERILGPRKAPDLSGFLEGSDTAILECTDTTTAPEK